MSAPAKDADKTRTSSDSSRRRSSQSGMFAGLTAQKRNAENAAYQQRRSSIEEQGPKQGVLGNLYNNVFKGPGSPSK